MKMSFGVKIRFLLLVLGCCLIATSISLSRFTTKNELLEHDAQEIQHNLLIKERSVQSFLADKKQVAKAKQFHLDPNSAIDFIDNYRKKSGINLLTYKNNQLKFWSTYKISEIDPTTIKEGSSVLFFYNGWYEVIKSTQGDFSLIFLITIQSQYPFKETKYFKNDIDPILSNTKILTFASFTDKDVYVIKSLDNKFLFGLKVKPGYAETHYSGTQLWLFVAGMLCICMFFNSLSSFIARRGHIAWGTFLLLFFFLAFRLTDLYYGWFNHRFTLDLFDPRIYADNFLMPSLGDFLLNVIALTWLLLFMYNHKEQYKFPGWIKRSKIIGVVIQAGLMVLIGRIVWDTDDIFFGLIFNSKINFDIVNILKLSGTSWVGIVILCLAWFQIYLITAVSATVSSQLNVTNKERVIIFLIGFAGVFIYKLVVDFNAFFIVFALVLFIVARAVYLKEKNFSIGMFAIVFFCLAFNTSIKYTKYKDIKERSLREPLARKVQSSEDPNAIIALGTLGNEIVKDNFLTSYFTQNRKGSYSVLKNHIKDYLDGYLNRYDYQIYPYDRLGAAIENSDTPPIDKYKNLVEVGSVKIDGSNFFYQVNNTFGYQDYFGIISVVDKGSLLGTLVIELRSKPYNYNNRLPDLLGDQKMIKDEDFKGYSIALYSNNKLLNQSGNYTYPLDGSIFKGKKDDFITSNDNELRYSHLIYKPTDSKMVVISKEKVDYVERLAALSFFFLIFIIFSLLLYGLIWLIKNLDDDKVGWFSINRSLMINANKILYKTRIQVSIVLAVVATLVIVGWGTYYYMNNEYRGQQDTILKDKIRKVQQNFEKQIFSNGIIANDENAAADFNNFADINNADLNLYDLSGNLIMTTYPKLYNYKIIGKKMGPSAFASLGGLHRSEFINAEEKIGNLTYAAAYAPIRNAQNKTIAYIGLPNYSTEEEYTDKLALFVSNLINLYALVFVAIGVLAVFLANQITSPLTFIQDSISKTKIGQKNEPIVWRRHDEIGSLIKEYNHMIAALEDSAIKLARSERESAWREMAKQVAHEIKNPLTPLKLGVQLLEKSWKEKDPNFELKFNKFSKSFIEQIDSLSKIASEFSNFAKMPDTNLERLSLLPIIEQAREVFKSTENVTIDVLDKSEKDIEIMADHDQLLRTFNNLLKNAIEAIDEETLCCITIIIYVDAKNAYIEIKDNGKGIPPALHDKIFVPNFTTKTSGTGLGLAFVKQAVENAGGSVKFTSISGLGTTFYLNFPLA
ncbi:MULTISPECIES: HAMP domain-containing sensor histidine kinase [unclassified Pedobacter]|uniref:sensor histidine kinase n=1 Tax=unclassified Pedobacter TaxID=2628915 RepID=UPI001D909C12|nr:MULTISPECIES: HAMP domain-containing sensor histidine kinase [unclassified Pedobacter]CAH0178733.1 Sensor protein ZraS [Pedobacter sp. Bi36]CAH0234725.1 Sensor protein ZraS [Pedobacter sp. Bi126]